MSSSGSSSSSDSDSDESSDNDGRTGAPKIIEERKIEAKKPSSSTGAPRKKSQQRMKESDQSDKHQSRPTPRSSKNHLDPLEKGKDVKPVPAQRLRRRSKTGRAIMAGLEIG